MTEAEAEGIVQRLRSNAEIVSHEDWHWLRPLLLESAEEIERLRAALEPFAKLADDVKANRPGWDHDDFYFDLLGGVMTLAPFRKARAVLDHEQSMTEKT